jgi:5-epi-alpha-selinene synthase
VHGAPVDVVFGILSGGARAGAVVAEQGITNIRAGSTVNTGDIDWAALPALYVPFPSAINERADSVHRSSTEWLRRFLVLANETAYRRFSGIKIGRLAARFHPEAPLDALQLISHWYGWMFFWDDQRDETEIGKQPGSLAARKLSFLEVLTGSGLPESDALVHALWDLRERELAKVATESWMSRFFGSVEERFASTFWEATNRTLGITPDIDSYVRMRPVTGGLNIDTQFIEIAEHAYPSPEIWRNDSFRRMVLASNNAVCWANDIFSLEKEIRRNDVHNLVLILQQEEDLTLPAAVDGAIEMHNAEVRVFIDSASQLQQSDGAVDDELRRFVTILQTRMRGFVDWAHESGRYRSTVSIGPSVGGPR